MIHIVCIALPVLMSNTLGQLAWDLRRLSELMEHRSDQIFQQTIALSHIQFGQ